MPGPPKGADDALPPTFDLRRGSGAQVVVSLETTRDTSSERRTSGVTYRRASMALHGEACHLCVCDGLVTHGLVPGWLCCRWDSATKCHCRVFSLYNPVTARNGDLLCAWGKYGSTAAVVPSRRPQS